MCDADALIGALASQDKDAQDNAYRVLQESYDVYAERLIAELRNPDLETRRAVAMILCMRTEPRAADAFLAALDDVDHLVRMRATLGLAKLKDQRAVRPLRRILWHDSDSIARSRAAHALGMIGGPGIYEELLTALGDSDEEVCCGAVHGLGCLGDRRAVSHLVEVLGRDDPTFTYAVSEALSLLGDPDAVEPLIQALRNPDDTGRMHVALALAKIGDERALEPLILALRTGDPSLRCGAALALARFKDSRTVPHLLALLNDDEDGNVRSNAIGALVAIDADAAVAPLLHALSVDQDAGVRWVAAGCLGEIVEDGSATDALLSALQDPHPIVRSVAISALGNTGDVLAVQPLIAILAGPDSEASSGRLHSDEVVSIEYSAEGSSDRISAATALGKLGGEAAVEALIAALTDGVPAVRSAAAKALEGMDDPLAAEALQRDSQ